MRSRLQRAAAFAVLLAAGSCAWRAEPPRPEPEVATPAAVSLPEPEPEPEPVPPAVAGMNTADAVWSLGRPLQAEALLGEVHRVARRDGQTAIEARALMLEAVLVWARNVPEDAVELFRRAATVEPEGPSGDAARLALDTLLRLDERERELERVRSRLVVAEKDRDDRAADTQDLLEQVTALREQLDALKQVHLETESEKEKEDDPS